MFCIPRNRVKKPVARSQNTWKHLDGKNAAAYLFLSVCERVSFCNTQSRFLKARRASLTSIFL